MHCPARLGPRGARPVRRRRLIGDEALVRPPSGSTIHAVACLGSHGFELPRSSSRGGLGSRLRCGVHP